MEVWKMPKTIKFWIIDKGDSSVGMDGWCEEITVTRSRASEFNEDEVALLKKGLEEALGESCLTDEEMDDARS